MIDLNWQRCGDDRHFCSLEILNLSGITSEGGVYIIWHSGDPSRVVRVGQGDIPDRLSAHRNNPEILSYGSQGTLKVTWANVPLHLRDGVERYLADHWHPLVGDAFPDAVPIEVNSPW